MTAFIDYQKLFPDTTEIRHLILLVDQNAIPAGEYSLNEMYCIDSGCDCQLVRFQVVSVRHTEEVAVLTFLFGGRERRPPDGKNPFVEPMVDNGPLASAIRNLVASTIERDPAYRARLERHYGQVKQFMIDHPEHPLHKDVEVANQGMERYFEDLVEGYEPFDPRSSRQHDAKRRHKRKMQRQSRKRNR